MEKPKTLNDGSVLVPMDMVWDAGLSISKFWDLAVFERHFKCKTTYVGEHRAYLKFQNKADASMFLLRWA